MALLDIRHFVTPLKNRMNLVIILAMALVFALYRTSTNRSSIVGATQKPTVLDDDFLRELEKALSNR